MKLAWLARDAPLDACAVVAAGAPARALAARLLAHDDDGLTAVAGRDLLVVIGEAARLPWVDGVVYLGRDPAAPSLLLPTALAPTVPPAALALAVRGRGLVAPVAVLASPRALVACGSARAIDRAHLAAWRGRAA